jgi:hypothetical protein
MPEYRIYTIDGGKIAGPSTELECASDDEADVR